jgi:hypothetical protein
MKQAELKRKSAGLPIPMVEDQRVLLLTSMLSGKANKTICAATIRLN